MYSTTPNIWDFVYYLSTKMAIRFQSLWVRQQSSLLQFVLLLPILCLHWLNKYNINSLCHGNLSRKIYSLVCHSIKTDDMWTKRSRWQQGEEKSSSDREMKHTVAHSSIGGLVLHPISHKLSHRYINSALTIENYHIPAQYLLAWHIWLNHNRRPCHVIAILA